MTRWYRRGCSYDQWFIYTNAGLAALSRHTMNPDAEITKELARGTFTDEMLANMRSRIGTEIRTEGFINNEVADRMAILRFAEGIGDDNPLWIDPEYASELSPRRVDRAAELHLCVPGISAIRLGRSRRLPCRDHDDVPSSCPARRPDHRRESCSMGSKDRPRAASPAAASRTTSGRSTPTTISELVATFICSRVRFERTQTQKRRESRTVDLPHPWTEEQLAAIEADILAEQPRGGSPRYWEDVAVGDEIDVVTKGPIGLTDEIAFIAAGAAPIPRIAAHRVSLKQYRRHPRWAFRDPTTHALEPVYSVHYNDYAAKLQGAQMAYDVGIQRTCWQIHSLTNWMGDSRLPEGADIPVSGPCLPLRRRPPRRPRRRQGRRRRWRPIVRFETWATNQRGDNVMPGTAVIALPQRGNSESGAPGLPRALASSKVP